jgi:hypothetical protein
MLQPSQLLVDGGLDGLTSIGIARVFDQAIDATQCACIERACDFRFAMSSPGMTFFMLVDGATINPPWRRRRRG